MAEGVARQLPSREGWAKIVQQHDTAKQLKTKLDDAERSYRDAKKEFEEAAAELGGLIQGARTT